MDNEKNAKGNLSHNPGLNDVSVDRRRMEYKLCTESPASNCETWQ